MSRKRRTPKQRWAKKNRDKLNAACRRWRARHPERQKAATYRWREKNLAKWNAYMRRWRKRNPELAKAATRRRWQRLKRDPIAYARHLAASRKWAAVHPESERRRARRYRKRNLAKVRAYHRQWMNRWYRTHLQEARVRSRERRRQNIKKWRARDRRYYRNKLRNNPEWRATKLADSRLWVKRNPLRQRHRVALYRARKMGARGSHTLAEWMNVVRAHSGRCFYCGKRLNRKTLTKDHRNPLSRGGTDFGRNLVPPVNPATQGRRVGANTKGGESLNRKASSPPTRVLNRFFF
jgi:hypothetical protein